MSGTQVSNEESDEGSIQGANEGSHEDRYKDAAIDIGQVAAKDIYKGMLIDS
ncbi:hypothetical protein [Streptomyces sp. WZ-12]|uniref:hypothetical protein n=1 Tax=Streptomyces sp. WZ-12 TaxID=3030210 RepID=UPI002380EBBA|nr:hypothetical protein [Streptomyces sp. WZ-12]